MRARGLEPEFIALAQLFYSSQRTMRYRGPNGQWGVEQFLGGDLSNDVRILGEPGQMETVEQQRGRIDLLRFGEGGRLVEQR